MRAPKLSAAAAIAPYGSPPKDWLPPMIRVWRKQKLRILTGLTNVDPVTGEAHQDGWPTISITAALSEGGSSGTARQHFPEVYTGDGLKIWQALQGAPGEVVEIISVHYLTPGPAAARAERMGIASRSYWQQLDRAYFYLAGRLDRLENGLSLCAQS